MLTIVGAIRNFETKDVKFRKDTFHVVQDESFLSYKLYIGRFMFLKLTNGNVRNLYSNYKENYVYDKELKSSDDYHYFLNFVFLKFVEWCKLNKIEVIKSSEIYDKLYNFCKNESLNTFLEIVDELKCEDK